MRVATLLFCVFLAVNADGLGTAGKKFLKNLTSIVKNAAVDIIGNGSLSTSELQSALNSWGDSHGTAVGVSPSLVQISL